MTMEATKRNGTMCFEESKHIYWDDSDPTKKYISVTTLVGKYEQKFDEDFWSSYKALEKLIPADNWKIEKKSLLNSHKVNSELFSVYNIDMKEFSEVKQSIIDLWNTERENSCARGTAIHAELENSFYTAGKNVTLTKFGIGGKFECRKDYTELDLPYGVYPEYLIAVSTKDNILNIAGQIDCLVKNGNEITIIDHKTNKEMKMHSGYDTRTRGTSKMKYPLNHLDDCNYNHYQLQLSLYAWMLQKINPNFIIKDLILNYYDHEGNNKLFHCDYLKKEVERMLIYYKKELKRDLQKQKRTAIVY